MDLTLYSRPDCHLCEQMLRDLQSWQKRFNFNIQVVDIDTSKQLTELYAARIPVLCQDKTELCQYILDETALMNFFQHNQ